MISCCNLFCKYSTVLVAIMAIGKKVNTKTSLLLLVEIKKITIPIKVVKTSFLYDAWRFNGLLVSVKTNGKIKNRTKTVYIEKAIFWYLLLK